MQSPVLEFAYSDTLEQLRLEEVLQADAAGDVHIPAAVLNVPQAAPPAVVADVPVDAVNAPVNEVQPADAPAAPIRNVHFVSRLECTCAVCYGIPL